MDVMDWFIPLLNEASRRPGWTQRRVADALGISEGSISKYDKEGSIPNARTAIRLLELMGGDISRAFPDYEPPVNGEIEIAGTVTATADTFSVDDAKRSIPGGIVGYLQSSRLYGATHGKIVFLGVNGNSMEPEYPNGSLLICRQPASPAQLPDNTPVIARINGESTFKLLQRIDEKTMLLVPLNVREHRVQSYPAKEVQIDLVVIGRVIPNEFTGIAKAKVARRGRKKAVTLKDVEV